MARIVASLHGAHRSACKPAGGVAFVGHMRYLLPWISLTGCGLGGAMHQATLVGQCAADDVACSRRHPQAPIAIGTHFYPEVSTDLAGGTTPNLRLESAVPEVVAVEDGALVARKAGTSAVLISTDDGSIVDFVHVWVAPVTKITLARRDGDRIAGAIALAVGEDVTLVPALWNGAQRLSGDGEAQWTAAATATATATTATMATAATATGIATTAATAIATATATASEATPGPVAILRDGSADRRRLRARAPGKTTVTVALGDVTASVDVEVVP
jgi:hypothetical protein